MKNTCGALAEVVAARRGLAIARIYYPDEEDRNNEAVDMVVSCSTMDLVIEHTRSESFPRQIQEEHTIKRLLTPVKSRVEGQLPTPGHYELSVATGSAWGAKGTKRIQRALVEWIVEKAPLLEVGSPDVAPARFLRETPPGVPFEVALYRWLGRDGEFCYCGVISGALQDLQVERIRTAMEAKCPKLAQAKRKGDSCISILLLESNDICLSNWLSISRAVEQVLPEIADAPHEIYLAKTEIDPWYIWVIKEGVDVYRGVKASGPYTVPVGG